MKRYRTYLPDFIFGSIDGLVTTFAIVSGVIGASLSIGVILILGFANLFADGFSMAVSNYLSSKSNEDLGNGTFARKPVMAAVVTFISFVVVGFVPLITFIIDFGDKNFFLASLLTAISFLWVGYIKGVVTNTNKFSAAFQTLLIGALAAVIAYVVGFLLSGLGV